MTSRVATLPAHAGPRGYGAGRRVPAGPTPHNLEGLTMSITTSREGRNLLIHVEDIDDPFVAKPLPGRAGIQITETFLHTSVGAVDIPELNDAMIMAVDGGTLNPDTGRWEPVPVESQITYSRIMSELSQSEAESVLMPAFFWQTTLGADGVRAYIDGGCGLAGTLRAAQALAARVGMLAGPLVSKESADV